MKKRFLFTPGPSNVPPEVLAAMARPIVHHRSPDFDPIFAECSKRLQYVFQTENPVLTFASSGTGAMEAAVTGTLSPGDTMITIEGGKFGQRWGDIGRAYGMNVVTLAVEWGDSVDPARVAQALKDHSDAKAVFATLCETSTATLTDIEALGKVIAPTDAILAVDAISGLAADVFKTDAWGVDLAVAGSQKALMLPPGLAFLAVSAKARKLIETAKCPSYYFNLKKALKNLADNTTAYTPAVSLIVGLNVALRMIEAEELPNVWCRHSALANALRRGGNGLGLRQFSKAPSNAVVAWHLPEGVSYKDLSLKLRDEHGLTIAGGQDHLKGKIFRAAAMGWADLKDVISFLGALERVLTDLGYAVPQRGGGVAGALEELESYELGFAN
ncbi:MAG TPA: alanine--glyoxylate aminotransferase family protein [Candidatus Sumerlaeota bacterium]|nr:alanine--glyoxylate aminotransferase family protein [Candidatus Sumerlaeota bacterium]